MSPEGTSDNVFRMVEAGDSARYEYTIPSDHPTGTFWYHPHHHGTVADQMFGGLFGALLIAEPEDAGTAQERVLVVSDTTLTDDGEVAAVSRRQVMAGREGELVLVNGQLRPRIDVTSGSPQRWRVVNACTSRFLELALDKHPGGSWDMTVRPRGAPRATPSSSPRATASTCSMQPLEAGTFTLRTLAHDRGGMGMMDGGASETSAETALPRSRSRTPAPPRVPLHGPRSAVHLAPADLRGETLAGRRTITFTMGMGMEAAGA